MVSQCYLASCQQLKFTAMAKALLEDISSMAWLMVGLIIGANYRNSVGKSVWPEFRANYRNSVGKSLWP